MAKQEAGKYQEWMEKVQKEGAELRFVPVDLIDKKMSLVAVRKDPKMVEYVPKEFIDPDIFDAIRHDALADKYVPDDYRDWRGYIVDKDALWAIWDTKGNDRPKAELEERWKDLLSNNGYLLYNLPEKLFSYEMCKVAVFNVGNALEFVPEAMRDKELCHLAVTTDYLGICSVPEKEMTDELIMQAVTSYGLSLEYVPDERKSPDICLVAYESDQESIVFVPEKFKDKEGNLLPREEMERIWEEQESDNSPAPNI